MSLRTGLLLFLLLTFYEGAIRKWVLPGSEQIVYLAKDVLLIALFALHGVSGRRRESLLKGSLVGSVIPVFVGWVALQAVNPALPSLELGIFGFKTYVLYLVFLSLVPMAYANVQELETDLRRLLWLMLPVLALGIAQFGLPPGHWLNQYVKASAGVATFGADFGRARITSTFPYITGLVTFLSFAFSLCIGLLAARRWAWAANSLPYLALALTLMVMPMTGSRGPVFAAALTLPLFVLGAMHRKLVSTSAVLRLIVPAIVIYGAVSYYAADAISAFELRRTTSDSASERFWQAFTEPFDFADAAGILGYGAGSTHQAAPALTGGDGSYSWLPIHAFEGEPGRVMIEIGGIGFCLFFFIKIGMCALAWQAMTRGQTPAQVGLAGAALMFFVAHIYAPMVFNSTAGALFWFLGGVVLLIRREQTQALRVSMGWRGAMRRAT